MEKYFDRMQVEEQLRVWWQEQGIYATDIAAPGLYSVDTPPPTVSGKLHIGHVFSYTQTDVLVRFNRMAGRPVFYPMGFDDNGLPTERFVELNRGVTPQSVGPNEFRRICIEAVAGVEEDFRMLWSRLGLSVDWNMSYSTIDARTQKISQESFVRLFEKGLIYRKEDPALYCTAYQTSVSQADLEDVEKETLFTDIAFQTETESEVVISTTRPELLYSCVALLFHPDDTRYRHLLGQNVQVPLAGHWVPVIADDKVQIDKGTGLVMCCTFGDKTDIEWYKRHKFPYRQTIGFDGRMMPTATLIAGLKVPEARKKILAILEEAGCVRGQKTITHSVSIYERSKREVEYLMLSQWFVKILPFKETLLKLADELVWNPSFMKARFVDWVSNLQWDWCISRQRYSGVPFPVWYDKNTGKPYVPDISALPVDPREDAFPGEVPAGVELVPDTEVMDTWNTSSLTPYICKSLFKGTTEGLFDDESGSMAFLPMAVRPQAHDIIRTWAFYTMVKTYLHNGCLPWKEIVISGHVLSRDGGKISKSKGNNPLEPENLLATYPADVIRYWTTAGTLGQDVAFSENTLKIGGKLLNKLWNAAKFVTEHTQDVDPVNGVNVAIDGSLNQWILHRVTEVFSAYTQYFERNEFSLALGTVEQFFWGDYCDNYLEYIKPILFKPENYDAELVASSKSVLAHVTLRVLQLFAPCMPFVTEHLYQYMFAERVGVPSLHKTNFVGIQERFEYPDAVARVLVFARVVDAVRKLKSEKNLSLKVPLTSCVVVCTQEDVVALKQLQAVLCPMMNIEALEYATTSSAGSQLTQSGETWHATIVLQ